MRTAALKSHFLELLTPPLPNDWEVEENLEPLKALSPARQELVLKQVPAIWPVSNSLCYSYLGSVSAAMECLSDQQLAGWVAAILDIYEQKGLREAQHFMTDISGHYLCRLRGESGVELAGLPHLQTYAQGLLGQPVRLAPGQEVWTDTETIFLPARVTRFASDTDNFLFYKLLLTLQVGVIRSGSCHLSLSRESPLIRSILVTWPPPHPTPEMLLLADFFRLFPDPRLAEDIFTLAETWRLKNWLAETYPGLWRDSGPLRRQTADEMPGHPCSSNLNDIVEGLRRLLLSDGQVAHSDRERQDYQAVVKHFLKPAATPKESAVKTAAILTILADRPCNYEPTSSREWLVRLHPEAAWQVRLRNRETTRDRFVKALAIMLLPPPTPNQPADEMADSPPPAPPPAMSSPTTALLMRPGQQDEDATKPPAPLTQTLLTLDGPEFPAALKELAAEITRDLGGIPAEYISAAHGLSGNGPPAAAASAGGQGESLIAPLTYDEWDFRRQGFRRDWCVVNEKSLEPVKSTLVARTISKYHGQLRQLRRQFELLRTKERFVRRQPDGCDFDLDAVIESLSDRRAGLAGSDQLFIRLRRDERDIAAFFLVDMSSSTEGWVNQALQEALILTGEALHTIGDRFAIAGFSGMRRSRTDIYQVKDFAEPYSETVKARIAAIAPKEYTRMGPAIRHASRVLQGVEAKVRLLIVLSDGKPEDYDDYKGAYAIEDTRHALIEAKTGGIHPFCITIDRQAHAYMPHMYGEVNYIFLDDVGKLPLRMPAIYRNLTT